MHESANTMRSTHETITSRIPRTELIGLLDTMTPFDQQRVTAEIEVPAEILPVEDDVPQSTSQLDIFVRFVSHAGSPLSADPAPPVLPEPQTVETKRLPSWAIVVASGVVTLLLGCLTMAAA